jgi:hypothetical protein
MKRVVQEEHQRSLDELRLEYTERETMWTGKL